MRAQQVRRQKKKLAFIQADMGVLHAPWCQPPSASVSETSRGRGRGGLHVQDSAPPLFPHARVRLSAGRRVPASARASLSTSEFLTLVQFWEKNPHHNYVWNFLEVKRAARVPVSHLLYKWTISRNICSLYNWATFSECWPRVGWARAWRNGLWNVRRELRAPGGAWARLSAIEKRVITASLHYAWPLNRWVRAEIQRLEIQWKSNVEIAVIKIYTDRGTFPPENLANGAFKLKNSFKNAHTGHKAGITKALISSPFSLSCTYHHP